MQLVELFPNKTDEIIKFYTQHKDEAMYKADQKALNYLTLVCNYDNDHRNDGWWKARNRFLQYFRERKQKPIDFSAYDVDLSDEDAKQKLIAKGATPKEAEKLLRYYDVRQAVIQRRAAEEGESETVFNAFQVENLGWINCDRFYDIKEEKKELMVQVKGLRHPYAHVFLVFGDIMSVMPGTPTKEGGYFYFDGSPRSQDRSTQI